MKTPYIKFEAWFPYYRKTYNGLLAGACSNELVAFRSARGLRATNTCYDLYNCLSAGLHANELSNLQSAQVLLGLTPTLLATLAPSIGEIALVSSRRKFFAVLLALGNPAVFVPRLLAYTDPKEFLHLQPSAFPDVLLHLGDLGRPQALSTLAVQYLLAFAALVNVIEVAWRLGCGTVIAWKCPASWLPFIWTMLPLILHAVAALGWYLSSAMESDRRRRRKTASGSATLIQELLRRAFRSEFDTGLCGTPLMPPDDDPLKRLRTKATTETKLALFFNELAGFGAFLQLLFGTLVFSSLMFITTIDALVVITRYVASGLVCRFLVTWELARLRAVELHASSHLEDGLQL